MDTPDIRNTKEDAETIWGELSGTEDGAWGELLLDEAKLRTFIVEVLGYNLSYDDGPQMSATRDLIRLIQSWKELRSAAAEDAERWETILRLMEEWSDNLQSLREDYVPVKELPGIIARLRADMRREFRIFGRNRRIDRRGKRLMRRAWRIWDERLKALEAKATAVQFQGEVYLFWLRSNLAEVMGISPEGDLDEHEWAAGRVRNAKDDAETLWHELHIPKGTLWGEPLPDDDEVAKFIIEVMGGTPWVEPLTERDKLRVYVINVMGYWLNNGVLCTTGGAYDLMRLWESWKQIPTPTDEDAERWATVFRLLEEWLQELSAPREECVFVADEMPNILAALRADMRREFRILGQQEKRKVLEETGRSRLSNRIGRNMARVWSEFDEGLRALESKAKAIQDKEGYAFLVWKQGMLEDVEACVTEEVQQ